MQLPKKGKDRHYTGGLYEVIDTAKHSETEEFMVIYKEITKPLLWVRPLEMFTEYVEYKGECIPRFAYMG